MIIIDEHNERKGIEQKKNKIKTLQGTLPEAGMNDTRYIPANKPAARDNRIKNK